MRLLITLVAASVLVAAGAVNAAPPKLTLVALGDSIPYGKDCGGCTGYVALYAKAAGRALGATVTVDNRAEHNNLGSTQLLAQVRHSSSLRTALRRADIVTITIGHNDTPWASSVDACDGSYSDTVDDDKLDWPKYTGPCLAPVAAKLHANLGGILAEIKRLRAGRPTLLRVTNFHNDHINDPTDLPETYEPSKTIVDALNAAICKAASQAKLPCVDVYHAFNGPSGTLFAGPYMAADGTHPNQRGHALIARLLERSGYAPLRRVVNAVRSAGTLCVGGPHCYPSVQAALAAAQDGDTIRVGPGTFDGGITITKSINVIGVAAAATIIRGGGPVVTIGSPSAAPTVTLTGLTITGGVTTTNPQAPSCGPDVPRCGPGYADATALGGGIEAFQGTTVTITGSLVTGNRSSPALTTASVKAVCPGSAPCPVNFGDAAGIDNWGTMTLIDTTVSDNHASAIQSDGGGIVSEQGSSLTLVRSRVVGNSANAVGAFGRFVQAGGILADHEATLTIEASNIDGNSANLTSSIPHPYPLQDGGTDQSNAFSGGIHLNDDVVATIRNSTLNGNSITVNNPFGEPFGGDAAMCACGSAAITLENAQVKDNTVTFYVLSTADSGPDGSAFEADNSATIENVQFTGNTTSITAVNGDAGALGALLFLRDDDTSPPTISDSSISDNVATATAPHGAATVLGAGLVNNAPLTLTHVDVERNHGTATGLTGSALGGGIWNGQLFGGPDSPLTLVGSQVKNNVLEGIAGVTLQGGGIFTPGFPLTLTRSSVKHNAPDDCFGC